MYLEKYFTNWNQFDMTLLMNSFYRMFSTKEDHFSMNTFNSKNRMRSKVHSFLGQFFARSSVDWIWWYLQMIFKLCTFSWHQLKETPNWANWRLRTTLISKWMNFITLALFDCCSVLHNLKSFSSHTFIHGNLFL